jgi:hypothetical protein
MLAIRSSFDVSMTYHLLYMVFCLVQRQIDSTLCMSAHFSIVHVEVESTDCTNNVNQPCYLAKQATGENDVGMQ